MEERLIEAAERMVRQTLNWYASQAGPPTPEKARDLAATVSYIAAARAAEAQEWLARAQAEEVRKRAGIE